MCEGLYRQKVAARIGYLIAHDDRSPTATCGQDLLAASESDNRFLRFADVGRIVGNVG